MGYTATTVRLETDLKEQFDSICKSMGMNANIAFNIFVRTVVRKKGIPFAVEATEKDDRQQLLMAYERLRAGSQKNETLSDSEIDAEIEAYRKGL